MHNHLHVQKQNLDSLIRWKNNSGETVPPFGVVEVESYVALTNTYVVRKPTSSGKLWYANGPVPVADQAYGASYLWHLPQQVLCSADPDPGDGLSPEADSWELTTGSEFRFLAWIDEDGGIASAIGNGGGSDGGSLIIHFDITEVDCNDSGDWLVSITDYTGSCEGEIPGADPYTGEYYVRPACGSPFTDEELEASGSGSAVYTYNRETCERYWKEITHCARTGCDE